MFGRDILQNFAYRSICEHIRRAHPDNWIPKLPASAETFAKMVSLSSRGSILTGGFPLVRKPVPSSLSSVYRKTSKRKLPRQSNLPIFFSLAFSGVAIFCRSWVINLCLLMTTYIAMQKHEDDQYLDGMSPPSSANESETLQSISLSNNLTNFQSRFPPAMSDIDHDDDDSFMDDEEMGGDSHEERSGTVSLPYLFHLHYFRSCPTVGDL